MPATARQNPAIGDSGELWFAAQLPSGWVWQPPRRDVGKDALIVIKDGSDLQNLEFSVQIKTTTHIQTDGSTISYSGIPTSSVLYWFASPQPTMLVVVDAHKRRAWYSWHLDLFDSPSALSGKRTCSVRLPVTNQLDDTGWPAIRDRVRRHYSRLQDALHTARVASAILPAIGQLATATRDLIWLDREPDRRNKEDFSPDDHESLFLLLHDQTCYRNILAAVTRIRPLIHRDSDFHKQVTLWIAAFEAHVAVAYPDFASFPKTDDFAGLRIVFDAKAIKPKRSLLESATLDMIAMLSYGNPQNDA
jgi:hypothetical protein